MNHYFRQIKFSSVIVIALVALVLLSAGSVFPAQAQTYAPLYTFDGPQWLANPLGQLALGQDGNFYGLTSGGSINEIYQITPDGNETTLWVSPDQYSYGTQCYPGLTLGPDGLFYGSCMDIDQSWTYGSGAIFKYNPTASPTQSGFSILYEFPDYGCSVQPNALTLNTDGNFYGTTQGSNCGSAGLGSFFKITPSGTLTTLHTFAGDPTDAAYPSALTLGSNGNFYGTSTAGGAYNGGTLFEITAKGKVTLLYSFNGNTGPYEPAAPPTQGANGYWYGTTWYGGTSNNGTIFELKGKTIDILHSFTYDTDNAGYPNFRMTLGPDGNLYSSSQDTNMGGYGPESIFEITTAKTAVYSDLFNWMVPGQDCNDTMTNGCFPGSPLAAHPNGMFYGVTEQGGGSDEGVFYSFSMGFKPYILLQYPRGTIGTSIGIFGTGLTGTTAVSFDGIAATSFTVVSDTYMTAVIPTGAKTGYVTVTTPGGSLKSAIKLTVVK